MKDLTFSEFHPSTPEQWIRKIEKDLREMDLHDLDWNVAEDIKISPFQFQNDQAQISVPIPASPWKTGEFYHDYDPELQDHMETAIKGGADILFISQSNLGLSDLLNRAENIIRKPFFDADNSEIRILIKDGFNEEQSVRGLPKGCRLLLSHNRGSFPLPHSERLDRCFVSEMVDPTLQLTDITNQIQDFLDQFDTKQEAVQGLTQNAHIFIPVSTSYLQTIVHLRSMKIIWGQILSQLEARQWVNPAIMAYVGDTMKNADDFEVLVRSSWRSAAAVLGGAESLFIDIRNDEGIVQSDIRLLSRNIQHILRMEAHLDNMNDPVVGSYYFDRFTREMVEAVWTRVMKKRRKDKKDRS